MRNDLPTSIQDTKHDLAPDALVVFFQLTLADGTVFRLSPKGEFNWRGQTYDEIPCVLTDISQDADGKVGRPKFTFANPGGLFTAEIYGGRIDNAMLTRFRVLKADLDADRDFAVKETFRVSRIINLNKTTASVELRDVMDGHQFKLPARAYFPPEFPHVRLA